MNTHTKLISMLLNNTHKHAAQALRLSLVLGGAALSFSLQAESPSLDWQVDLGGEYDSNVSLVELDKVTNQGDWATTASLGATSQWTHNKKFKLRAGLQLDHKHYLEFDQYDLDVGRGNVEASYDFSLLTLGVSHLEAIARLDQQGFLKLSQNQLFASKLINQNFYLRGQVSQQDKDFADQAGRNASNQAWGGDVYWFMNQGNSYLSAGIGQEDESADNRDYSYQGVNLKARWSHNFSVASLPSQVQLGWRYVEKDFEGPAQIAESNALASNSDLPLRADRQQHLDAKWNLTLNSVVSLAAKVSYGDYQSNVSSADYQEVVTSLQVQSRF